jgi:thiol-disulfide isomerase/thioredoxin
MKKLFFLVIATVLLFSFNQEPKEIHFVQGNFKEVLEQASKANKLVFIDCYTSWCAPCKWMEKNVFIDEEVSSFYNSSFINYKIDMEKGEGPELAKKYGVRSYPTYLFLNAKGELIHLASSKMSALEFIKEGKSALDPKKSTGILSEKYAGGQLSNEELSNYVVALKKLRDPKTDEVFGNLMSKVDVAWLKSLSGFKLMEHFVYEETSALFQVLDQNKAYFVSLAGQEAVNKVYQKVLYGKMNESSRSQNTNLFLKQLDSLKKLTNNPRDIAIVHCQFYLDGGNAKEFVKLSNHYADNFLSKDPETIAFIARSAFFKVKEGNSQFIDQASHLIKKAYLMNPDDYGTVSTFAEIQSKVGNKEVAIKAAEKAVRMADTISSKVKNRAEQELKKIKEAN